MADKTKTQIPKPTRQRGPMVRMGGMAAAKRPRTLMHMRQLLG